MGEAEEAESRRREARREYNRRWRAEHPEQVRAAKQRWVDSHLEEKRAAQREYERRHKAERREAKQARERLEAREEAKRRYAREWYAANKPLHQEIQRQYRDRQRAENPEIYRGRLRAANQRWRDNHREQIRQHQRDKNRDAPEVKRQNAARYYSDHGDEIKRRKRDRYWANHEKSLEEQRQYRARETWRRDNGLPAQRAHRATGTERKSNLAAAVAFFARARSADEIERLREERGTPQHLIDEFLRASARHRAAAHYTETQGGGNARLEEQLRPTGAERAAMARADEDARMDAIAAAINDRLRTQPKTPTPPTRLDGTTPSQFPSPDHRLSR